ncbi:MAG: hypothetical protein ACI4MI_05000 [Christensenellales bacterium]
MKKLKLLLVVVLIIAMTTCVFVACNQGDEETPEEPVVPEAPAPEEPAPVEPVVVLPTSMQVVNAIQSKANDDQQGYDYYLNVNGFFDINGIGTSANANYLGEYRYNKTTNDLIFRRETSGILLYDGTEYIFTNGGSRIKVKYDEDDNINSVKISDKSEEEMLMVNVLFEKVVNSLDVNNLTEVQTNEDSDYSSYSYKAKMAFASDNVIIQAILNKVENIGTNIDFKGLTFVNPQGGVNLYFNMSSDNSKIIDLQYQIDLSYAVNETTNIGLKVTYNQKYSDTVIDKPQIQDYLLETSQIESALADINASIEAVKNSDAYSLYMVASNEFDPGWNKLATVDSYKGLLYKNTQEDSRVDFNHSYTYKAHSETDGSESYKYTIGNIQDGSVYCVSRKGSNVVTPVENITCDTQFDYLTDMLTYTATDIDCIKVSTAEDGTTTYQIFVKDASTYAVQSNIVDIINSNDAEGVLDVDNYFNSEENEICKSSLSIVVKDGKLVSADCTTKIKYYPTAGDNQEYRITLTDEVSIIVDEWLSYALDYEAPAKAQQALTGLSASKYYIL